MLFKKVQECVTHFSKVLILKIEEGSWAYKKVSFRFGKFMYEGHFILGLLECRGTAKKVVLHFQKHTFFFHILVENFSFFFKFVFLIIMGIFIQY